jgi:cyclopropane fatty-acyl-phospholipid synthase-like methyltransferase
MPSPDLIDWWDHIHQTKNDNYLSSASAGEYEWNDLQIIDLIIPGKKVLYIGVGGGNGVKDLAAEGVTVSCLDISTYAEAVVKKSIEAFYTDFTLLPAEKFDLVLSHLVAQHMTDADLGDQIKNVLLSMKKDATFAMQFFMLDEGQASLLPELINDDIIAQRAGHVGRTQAGMQKLIEDNGGRIQKWGQTISFNELPGQPKWQIVHFGK